MHLSASHSQHQHLYHWSIARRYYGRVDDVRKSALTYQGVMVGPLDLQGRTWIPALIEEAQVYFGFSI